MASLTDGIKSQAMWPIHGGPIKIVIPNYLITSHQRTQAIPGSDLGLLELMFRVFYDHLLLQTLSGFLVEVGEFTQVVGSLLCIFHVIVSDIIGNDPLEYMEVQILDYPLC